MYTTEMLIFQIKIILYFISKKDDIIREWLSKSSQMKENSGIISRYSLFHETSTFSNNWGNHINKILSFIDLA